MSSVAKEVTASEVVKSSPNTAKLQSTERCAIQFDAVSKSLAFFSGPVITVIVGPAKVHFSVHKTLIASKSEYFRLALESGFQEAISSTFDLSAENASVFSFFVGWMYQSKLGYARGTGDTLAFLIDAYIFAERRGAQTFQNAVIGQIALEVHPNDGTLFDVVNLVFAETTHTSKLRRLIVDIVAWEGQVVAFQSPEIVDAIPPAFALGVYSAVFARMKANAIPICAYSQNNGPHVPRCGNSTFCKAENAHGAKLCLADEAEAPYGQKKFCANYHEHKEGESCK